MQYIPQLYVKLKGWNPPPVSLAIGEEITQFEKKMKKAVTLKNGRGRDFTTLTHSQKKTLSTLKHLNEFVIMPSDKNLGPTIMNHDDYITQVLKEHLLTQAYQYLDPTTAHYRINETKNLLLESYERHKHLLSRAETEYFQQNFKEHHRLPIFYGMPKVHKSPIT
jgi:hypothetical protein